MPEPSNREPYNGGPITRFTGPGSLPLPPVIKQQVLDELPDAFPRRTPVVDAGLVLAAVRSMDPLQRVELLELLMQPMLCTHMFPPSLLAVVNNLRAVLPIVEQLRADSTEQQIRANLAAQMRG